MKSETILVYERVLNGELWPAKYIGTPTTVSRSVEILHYLFFEKLKVPDFATAKKLLDKEFIIKYKLWRVISVFPKPPELLQGEYDHIIWVIFPGQKKGRHALVIKVYSEVLSGKRKAFPYRYFTDPAEGKYRADVCFKHLCRKILHLSADRIAWEFSHSDGIRLLAKYKLRIILNSVYFSLSELIYSVYPQLYPQLIKYQKQRDMRLARYADGKGVKK